MNQRVVVERRLATLGGLLDGGSAALGPNAGAIGERLREGWATERRLLERLAAQTAGDDVLATIAAWRERTRAFVERAAPGTADWTDRAGQRWEAQRVLVLLDETEERIAHWLQAVAADGEAAAR